MKRWGDEPHNEREARYGYSGHISWRFAVNAQHQIANVSFQKSAKTSPPHITQGSRTDKQCITSPLNPNPPIYNSPTIVRGVLFKDPRWASQPIHLTFFLGILQVKAICPTWLPQDSTHCHNPNTQLQKKPHRALLAAFMKTSWSSPYYWPPGISWEATAQLQMRIRPNSFKGVSHVGIGCLFSLIQLKCVFQFFFLKNAFSSKLKTFTYIQRNELTSFCIFATQI